MPGGHTPWDHGLDGGWEPPLIDTSVPHPNRIYNYLIGGKDHFQADRDAADRLIRARPGAAVTARAIESFTRRAVAELARRGLRQFLQLGAAITIENSNDRIAAESAPDVRNFVYVADDPISLAHARALLVGRPGPPVTVLDGGFRAPLEVLGHPDLVGALDFGQPVGLLLFCMLDYIADAGRARRALDILMGRAAPGSMAAFFHVTDERGDEADLALRTMFEQDRLELTPRSEQDVRDLLDGHEFLDPGLVPVTHWQPDGTGPGPDAAESIAALGGVILKR
jgi:hypothetical protein